MENPEVFAMGKRSLPLTGGLSFYPIAHTHTVTFPKAVKRETMNQRGRSFPTGGNPRVRIRPYVSANDPAI
jgi:hypothetical protein